LRKQFIMSRTAYPLLPTLGTISPAQIPGREDDITNLLRLLRSQSVSVEEMRRMGKTLTLLKLTHLCNQNLLPEEFKKYNFKARYLSFQGRQNLGEVIDLIIEDLKTFKEWYQIDFSKTYSFIRELVGAAAVEATGAKFSVKLPEFKKSWKDIFFKTLDEIAEVHEKANGLLILIFDELPIMLWEWYKNGKQEEAMELLDILRERRQALEKKGIRFIYCGSIGIKVVLNTFKSEFAYTGEPTNEMAEFNLKAFSKDDHDFLCECFLLSGFKINRDEQEFCLTRAFELTNGLPFYTSHIFNLIQTEFDFVVSLTTIESAYDLIINEPKHHGAFKQLIDRLTIYYPTDIAAIMKKTLTALSAENDFITEYDLFNKVNLENEELFRSGIAMLYNDHYLMRTTIEGKRAYKFKFEIFKQWWKVNIA
jgi:hypothetical protein